MATISKVKLPNGMSYDILDKTKTTVRITKDGVVRSLQNFDIIQISQEEYDQLAASGQLNADAFYWTEGEESGGSTGPSLPAGGTAGQILTKVSNDDGDATWSDFPELNYLPLNGGTVTGVTTFSNTTASSSTTTGAVKIGGGLGVAGDIYGDKVFGAVWNDYAEYRICNEEYKPGMCVIEKGDDTLIVSQQRLSQDGYIVSDTFGFSIGETEEAKCPVAVSGRVLAYTDEPRENFKPGDAVCVGTNGMVSKMSREEIKEYPERIIGTVSAIPEYETWGTKKIEVNGRIWIKVR